MKVIVCQLDTVWENKPASIARARALIASAGVEAGSLLVLPEMYATGFCMNAALVTENATGEAHAFLQSTAVEYGCHVLGGVATRSNRDQGSGVSGQRTEAIAQGTQRFTNDAVLYSPAGEAIARYSKQQTFTFGGETANYSSGDQTVVVDCGGFRLAPLICYDLRFPELFRIATIAGANLFVVIANWPLPRHAHWVALLAARAIENQAYVVGVNRAGRDPTSNYPGLSQIIDPHGRVIATAGDRETIISSTLELAPLLEYRKKFPILADLRAEMFRRE